MADQYLIHKAGRGWYRPDSCGYTLTESDAGRYSLEDAISITHPNGADGPRDGMTYRLASEISKGASCEDDLRIHELTLERDQLLTARDNLSTELGKAGAEIERLKAQIKGHEKAADFIGEMWSAS